MTNSKISLLSRIIIVIMVSLFTACSTYDTNLKDTAGNTLLHYAVFTGNSGDVKKFIKSGADVNASNNYGLTPLMCAAKLNRIEIIDLL
jgi:ankyrin repeat protein